MKRILRELVCSNPRPLEFILALQMLFFGGWLLLPFDTFSQSTVFATMRAIAPEEVWGSVILAVGLIQFFGVWTERIMARRALGALDLLLWTMVDLALWASAVPSAAPITFTSFILMAVIVNVNLAVRCE